MTAQAIKVWTTRMVLALRKKLGLTQREMAIKLKVDQLTISKWERGLTRPDIHNRKKLNRLERKAVGNGKTT
ncbi:MAG: helix-turn-helix domain-containing protein [Candidatus Peribacteraceae bacterium]|nr:helix-turn-helix domain-containing protein [Candidatus Peribacteraceae bacterium]